MLKNGQSILLLIPGKSEQRVLQPGKVLEIAEENVKIEFEEAISPAVAADVNIFAEVNGKFFQQGAIVVELLNGAPHPTLVIRANGEVVSAEQRQIFRVCTLTSEIFAAVNKQCRCPVMDLSSEGFSAVVTRDCQIGSVVPILIEHDGQTISGTARVQTAKKRPDGKLRYGFLVPKTATEARKALRNLSGVVQRSQLRRLAGAA